MMPACVFESRYLGSHLPLCPHPIPIPIPTGGMDLPNLVQAIVPGPVNCLRDVVMLLAHGCPLWSHLHGVRQKAGEE